MKLMFLFATLFSLMLTSCQSQSVPGSVDAITFNTTLQHTKDAAVLDVRTPEEFSGGHIGHAVNLDYYRPDFKTEIGKLDKKKTYFVYCQAGGRSKSAAELMHREGFTKVYELNGGIAEWEASNLPLSIKPD